MLPKPTLTDSALAIGAVHHMAELLRSGVGIIEASNLTVDWIAEQTSGGAKGANDQSGNAPTAE